MKTFRIKNEKVAQYILLIISVILLILAIYICTKSIRENNNSSAKNNLSPKTIESLPQAIREKFKK